MSVFCLQKKTCFHNLHVIRVSKERQFRYWSLVFHVAKKRNSYFVVIASMCNLEWVNTRWLYIMYIKGTYVPVTAHTIQSTWIVIDHLILKYRIPKKYCRNHQTKSNPPTWLWLVESSALSFNDSVIVENCVFSPKWPKLSTLAFLQRTDLECLQQNLVIVSGD